MPSNDRIILDQILADTRAERAPSTSASTYFEIFTAEQALKDYDLSYEEIENGIVGDGGDGGVDSIYVFANGDLLHEDSDLSALKKGVALELILVQAKTSGSFSESAVDKFIAVSEDLLDLSTNLKQFAKTYNQALREAVGIFRDAHATLASRFPSIRITYVYSSKGEEVHPNVAAKAEKLQTKVKNLFSAADVRVMFLGSKDLLELARRTPKSAHSLTLAETPISSSGDVGFVCLVRLEEFYSFITDDGVLVRGLFESNVRDYQGSTQVNEEIQETLVKGKEDFWWLNNGITVVASKATQSGKALTIEDPQIVNGLQTSTEIYNYFHSDSAATDTRNLLVRVIVPAEPASRDRIIKATNSQTYIPPASLRATDKIHRDIEEYLKPRGLWYDRRKNQYKNDGIALEKIIGISHMAQAVMAVALRRPDNARSRPSSLLKKDDDYMSIFSSSQPIGLYGYCGGILKRVEAFMREHTTLTQQERGNIRFHVAMHVSSLETGFRKPSAAVLAALQPDKVAEARLNASVSAVYSSFSALGATDTISKGADFLNAVEEDLLQRKLK